MDTIVFIYHPQPTMSTFACVKICLQWCTSGTSILKRLHMLMYSYYCLRLPNLWYIRLPLSTVRICSLLFLTTSCRTIILYYASHCICWWYNDFFLDIFQGFYVSVFLCIVNTVCDKCMKMFFVSHFILNMYLLRFCFSKLLYILYVRSIFILYSSVLPVNLEGLKNTVGCLFVLLFFLLCSTSTQEIYKTYRALKTFYFFFVKFIGKMNLLVCRWFRFAQLAKGKKSRP